MRRVIVRVLPCAMAGAVLAVSLTASGVLAQRPEPGAGASAFEKNYRAAAYFQDASFLRVRELSIGWELPARWSRFTRETTRVSLVGLDLLTLTPYKGVDPEITGGGPTNLPRFDLEKLPILPTVLVRVDVGGSAGN